ncbi:MAG: PEP-CTERM system TPR-repeat protein PrsT, partial [Rhodocyclaceae bacterium]|nr:PEP-CTERM system TPR-repeat protein PrsT [Rhodocyclaceae bacterium]
MNEPLKNMLKNRTVLLALMVALVTTACLNEKPEDQVKSAKEYLQKKDNKSATIQLKNALQKNPDLGEARFLLGKILLSEGNPVGAEVELRKAVSAKYPEQIVVPDLARALLTQGQNKQLIERYGATRFDQAAADASLQTSLAAAYRSEGDSKSAESRLTAALKDDPNFVPALMLLALQRAIAGDFDAALSQTEAILSKDPANAEAWKLKGDLLLRGKSKTDDALVAYRKSIEIEPSFEPGHLAVLTILMQKNKLEDASIQLNQLKKFAAKKPQTKLADAQLAYQQKDYKKAKELTQELLRLSSKSPRILQLAGAVEFQTNSLAQAETYLLLATQAEPQSVLSQKLLISTYLRSGQAAKALAIVNAISGAKGLDPKFFSLAGEVYLQNGDAKTAAEYFAKALKLEPNDVATRTALAVSHLAGGQSESGLDELQSIAGSDTGTTADMALISAHLKRRDFDKALVAVAKLESKQPNKPVAANLRGRIQLAQKDATAARKSFERALSIDPSYFTAAASLATLDMIDKKPEEAKKRFENLLTINPKNGMALIALAELAELRMGSKDEVVGLLTRAVDVNPNEDTPRLTLISYLLK